MKVTDNETRWAKIGHISNASFISREVLFFGAGCHLVFINLTTGEELLYTANTAKIGDGIQHFVGHRTHSVFAFAERKTNPTIFVKSYPNFEEIQLLKDGVRRGYLDMVFSDGSLLMTLGDLPGFNLTVWNWKLGERLMVSPCGGKSLAEPQLLKCNYGSPVFVAQMGVMGDDAKNLIVWDVCICGKKCILTHHKVKNTQISEDFKGILWTSDGGLFVLDSVGCVYTVLADHTLDKVIDFQEPGPYLTSFVWYKSGLAIAGPNNEIRHYKKSGTWYLNWSMVPVEPTRKLVARFEYLVAVTVNFNIVQVVPTQGRFKQIKEGESWFDDFCLVYPTGQYLMALVHGRAINVYKVESGELMGSLYLETQAILMVENPKFPYAAVGFKNGTVKLISTYDPEKPVIITRFYLMRSPVNSIRFNECGTVFVVANLTNGRFFIIEGLPGGQMEIIATIDAKRQVVDYMMAISADCYRIFVVPVTASECIAGNVVVRYCVIKDKKIKIKEYKFDDANLYCNRIVPSFGTDRDRVFYIVPHNGKTINEFEVKRGENVAKLVRKIVTGHQMRDFQLRLDRKVALTWGYDGFVIARGSDFTRNVAIALPHHRMHAGVKKAYIDPCEKYILSLGEDGVLACTNLMEAQIDPVLKEQLEDIQDSEDYKLLFSRRTVGYVPKGIYEGKCYLEVQEMKKIEKERAQCQGERDSILHEFKSIQRELQELLTANIEGPENEQLDLKEFNLNVKLHEVKEARHKKLRKATEDYLGHLIEAQNKVSDYMIANFWEKMKVPGTAIKGIFANFEVTNYVLRPPSANREETLNWIRQQRRLERYLNEMNSFHPWVPMPEEKLLQLINSRPHLPEKDEHLAVLSALEIDAPEIDEPEEDPESKIAFSGSDLARFIEVQDVHYLQNELQTYFQTELEWKISKSDSYKLKEYFNGSFNKIMLQKLKEVGNIKERNDRLRHIVSELNYFSQEKMSISIEDPEWKQTESPELITQVKNEEVPITPYISPSEQALLDAKAAEAERLRLLLLADDFRERALMKMMNGVLEVRWEDELKKDVPLPKCMVEKEPENFNEEDLKAVRDYDEKVQFLCSERERYKTMLRAEYGKVANTVRENIKKFNGKLNDLLQLKLSVDAAISQETLKISRMKLFQQTRKLIVQKEQETLQHIDVIDNVIEKLHKILNSVHDALLECRNYVDSFQVKEKFLERAYKKDFQEMSPVIQEQVLKLFKRRPKFNLRSINSATMLNELARCILANVKQSAILNHDCLEYLKQMDVLDMYVGVPTVVDEHTFAHICKNRRLRIEYELKLRAAQTVLAEGEATSATLHKRLHIKKESLVKLHNDLAEVRNEHLKVVCNGDMQIVMHRGLVEIPLSGRLEDFEDAVLICRKDVEDINKIILDFGDKKIKALQQAMNFRRKILALEWHHKRMRMLIEDLQEKLLDIDGVRLTKEIQFYLKTKDKERTIPFETEVDMIKSSYENTIQDRKDKVSKIKKQIKSIKDHDRMIERKVAELNVDVCEFNLIKDRELDEKEKAVIDTRMKTLLKRSKLIQQIQDSHHEILMLQTELELLRLKTFPTLKYKVV